MSGKRKTSRQWRKRRWLSVPRKWSSRTWNGSLWSNSSFAQSNAMPSSKTGTSSAQHWLFPLSPEHKCESLNRPAASTSVIALRVKATSKPPNLNVHDGHLKSRSIQVHFELGFKTCSPKLKVIAPWRLPVFIELSQGRQDLLKYASEDRGPISLTPKTPWFIDKNLALQL